MKKRNKEKKDNVKGKWAVWKTVVSVISAVIFITGATVLGVYAGGGFRENIINPASINFYIGDQDLNGSDSLKISGDIEGGVFKLMLGTPTENVTRDKVTLSFPNQTETNGFVSNSILQVPKVVTLGEEFEVRLLKTDLIYNGQTIEWIKGGISTLRATSEYNQLGYKELTIAVDTPVYAVDTYLTDMAGNPINLVVEGQEFKVAANFYPSESKFMYGNQAEEKHIFYATTQSGITPVYDDQFNMHFIAGEEASIDIVAYTFKNAETQIEVEGNSISTTPEGFYVEMFSYLSVNTSERQEQPTTEEVVISTASISSFDIGKSGSVVDIVAGEKTRLYMNRVDSENLYLGAIVNSTDSTTLTSMLQYLGLVFTGEGLEDFIAEGEIVEYYNLTTGEKMEEGETGATAVYFPFTHMVDLNASYWDFTANFASEVLPRNISVNVFLKYNNELFATGEDDNKRVSTKAFTIRVIDEQDTTPEFIDQDQNNTTNIESFVLQVNVDENGNSVPVPQPIDLASYINMSIINSNKYKDVVFFANFESDDLAEKMIGNAYVGTIEIGGITYFVLAPTDAVLTIYEAGSFGLRFATFRPGSNMSSLKVTDLVRLCLATKTFEFQKELNASSVDLANSLYVAYQNKEEVSGAEANLANGQNDSINVEFKISEDSLDVFKDAYHAAQISLQIFDGEENISGYFDITSSITDNILTYTLSLRKMSTNYGPFNLSSFNLIYNNVTTTESVTWTLSIKENSKITIYTPTASEISAGLKTETSITITQTLTNDGSAIVITKDDNSKKINNISDYLDAIIGTDKVVITDQKGRVDTLKDKWKLFIVTGDENAQYFDFSEDGKSFSLKTTEGQIKFSLGIMTNADFGDQIKLGGEAPIKINVTATSTGIVKIKYDSEIKNTDTATADKENPTVTSVAVSKYGSKDATITLKNLVKLYLDEKATSECEYSQAKFQFSTDYLTTAFNEDQFTALFGKNGMLKVYEEITAGTRVIAVGSKASLTGIQIAKIEVCHDFAQDVVLRFDIYDENKVVNIPFALTIKANVSVAYNDYSNVYASISTPLVNEVNNNQKGPKSTLGALYNNETYYLHGTNGTYTFLDSKDNSDSKDNAVGKMVVSDSSATIEFYDFWNDESSTFLVLFNPDNNLYGVNYTITFTVLRNLKITSKPYYLFDGENPVSNYLTIERIETVDGTSDALLEEFKKGLSYAFESDASLAVNNTNITANRVDFDYNVKQITETLTITHECGKTFDITINISLYKSASSTQVNDQTQTTREAQSDINTDWYETLSEQLSDTTKSINADVQIVDDVEYLVFDVREEKTAWVITQIPGTNLTIGFSGLNLTSYYEASTATALSFKNQANVLAGLGNESCYLYVLFRKSGSTAVIGSAKIPMIISKIGSTPVLYKKDIEDNCNKDIDENKVLEAALMTPDKLLEKGYYNTMTAGTGNELVKTSEGIVALEVGQTVSYYDGSLGGQAVTNAGIIKSITNVQNTNAEKTQKVNLNHLSNDLKNFYLPLKWTIGKDANGNDLNIYYLVKITPSVDVSDPLYAYNGTAEHINGIVDESSTFDFSSKYGATTLHNEETRFSVYNWNEIRGDIIKGLPELFTIKQVTVGLSTYTSQADWKQYITLSFNGAELSYTPKTSASITIVVEHSYPGGVAETDLSVIESLHKTFTLILNQNNENYGVRITTNGDGVLTQTADDKNGIPTYQWDISNVGTLRARLLNVELQSISGTTNTTIYDKLEIRCINGASKGKTIASWAYNASNVSGNVNLFYEDNAKIETTENLGPTTLCINLLDYIGSDKELTFALYTDFGQVATLNVKITANVSATLRDGYKDEKDITKAKLDGGTSPDFEKVFNVTLNGASATASKIVLIVEKEVDAMSLVGGKIKVANLFKEVEVGCIITLEFSDNNTFTFKQGFILKANLEATPYSLSNPITAGSSSDAIEESNFYNGTFESFNNLAVVSIAINPRNSDDFILCKNDNKWEITPKFVGSLTTMIADVTITLTFGSFTQTRTTTFTFTVVPAVSITTNYPNPTGEVDKDTTDTTTGIGVEYLTAGSYSTIIEFLNSVAQYADKRRIFVSQNEILPSRSTDEAPITIQISTLQNARLTIGDENILVGSTLGDEQLQEEMIFARGSSGTDSTIVFVITYKGVVVLYNIKIVDSVYTTQINMVTNNVSQETFNGNPVTCEVVYVDKTNSNDMFAQERLFQASTTSFSEAYADQYFFVFSSTDAVTKTTNYYVSSPIDIVANDQSTLNRIYDLGLSMHGKTFVGVFKASELSNEEKYTIDENNKLYLKTSAVLLSDVLGATGLTTTGDQIPNYATTFFGANALQSYKLINRVQLKYGDYLVASDKYTSGAKTITVTTTTTTTETGEDGTVTITVTTTTTTTETGEDGTVTITVTTTTTTTEAGEDGTVTTTTNETGEDGTVTITVTTTTTTTATLINTFNLPSANLLNGVYGIQLTGYGLNATYYYMPRIDIDIDKKVTSNGNSITLEVNNEQTSAVQLFGIKHPSTNAYVTKSEFGSSLKLSYEVIEPGSTSDSKTKFQEILDSVLWKSVGVKEFKGRSNLRISTKVNSAESAYDFTILPLGADNDGDYVLTKFTYTAGAFSEIFYVIIKVMPDYIVTYNNSQDNALNEQNGSGKTIISNYENVIGISSVNIEGEYEDFTLTKSEAISTGFVSVKHRYGLNTSQELASTFTIKLPTIPGGENIHDQTYNIPTNVTNKLYDYDLEEKIFDTPLKTAASSDVYTLSTPTTFTGVPKVVFADQYYYIDAEDAFGFKFRLYFRLQLENNGVSPSPVSTSQIVIEENNTFDIGAQYENLVVTKGTESNGVSPLTITSVLQTPVGTNLIALQGIEAWLFSGSTTGLMENGGSGYKLDNSDTDASTYSLNSMYDKYLNVPTINDIKITSVKLLEDDATINATISDDPIVLATTSEGRFNGWNEKRAPDGTFTMPRLTNTDLYGGTNRANVTLLITLGYYKTTTTTDNTTDTTSTLNEVYTCQVPIQVTRAVSIGDIATTVIDGEVFALDKQGFKLLGKSVGKGDPILNIDGLPQTTSDETTAFINDTLEIKVNANESVIYTLQLHRSDEPTIYKSIVESNEGYPSERTFYRSLSKIFGTVVKKDDTVVIIPTENSTTFTYRRETATTTIAAKSIESGEKIITNLTTTHNWDETKTITEIVTKFDYYWKKSTSTTTTTISNSEGVKISTTTLTTIVDSNGMESSTTFTQTFDEDGTETITQQTTSSTSSVDANQFIIGATTTLINDTLEIKVNANESVTYTLELQRRGELPIQKTLTNSNVSYPYNRTYYRSLSEIFETVVKTGDTVKIIDTTGNSATFIYRSTTATFDTQTTSNNLFTIGTIESDVIYLDSGSQLSNGRTLVTKYYVVACTISDSIYCYQTEKTYHVTGTYYQMSKKSSIEVNDVLTEPSTETTCDFSTWGNDTLDFWNLLVNDSGEDLVGSWDGDTFVINKPCEISSVPGLMFVIDQNESSNIGLATIDEDTGKISYNSSFGKDQYITVKIYDKVSGGGSAYLLGSIRLGIKETQTQT